MNTKSHLPHDSTIYLCETALGKMQKWIYINIYLENVT